MSEPIALPNLIKEAVSAIVKALVVFGVIVMTGEQLAALLLVVDPVMAVVATIYSRMKSTPVDAPVLPKDTEVTVVTPGTAPNYTTTV